MTTTHSQIFSSKLNQSGNGTGTEPHQGKRKYLDQNDVGVGTGEKAGSLRTGGDANQRTRLAGNARLGKVLAGGKRENIWSDLGEKQRENSRKW